MWSILINPKQIDLGWAHLLTSRSSPRPFSNVPKHCQKNVGHSSLLPHLFLFLFLLEIRRQLEDSVVHPITAQICPTCATWNNTLERSAKKTRRGFPLYQFKCFWRKEITRRQPAFAGRNSPHTQEATVHEGALRYAWFQIFKITGPTKISFPGCWDPFLISHGSKPTRTESPKKQKARNLVLFRFWLASIILIVFLVWVFLHFRLVE